MDYFSLIQSHPELFANSEAPLRLVLDRAAILGWQASKERDLRQKGRPSEWSQIGVVLDDPYNIILRDLVEFPDGDVRGYSRSIATATLRGGRGVVVLPEYQGKVLLLHLFRHPTRRWHYEVPRGYGEPNIPAEDNARKEVEEETGGEISELIGLGEFYNNTGYESASVALFFAKLASVGKANENEGIESLNWVSVQELEQWIADGTIDDGFTIAAYTRAKLREII